MHFNAAPGTIDVYPVGILAAIQTNTRAGRFGRMTKREAILRTGQALKRSLNPWRVTAPGKPRELNLRAVKSSFNGYLAEPAEWPPGLRRCGSGWTRNRALRDLERRIQRATA